MNLLVKKFSKFMKKKRRDKGKFQKKSTKKSDSTPTTNTCFECGNQGHIKANCPTYLKKQQGGDKKILLLACQVLLPSSNPFYFLSTSSSLSLPRSNSYSSSLPKIVATIIVVKSLYFDFVVLLACQVLLSVGSNVT